MIIFTHTINVEVEEQELWEACFGTGVETYPWWKKIAFLDGCTWDRPGLVRLGIEDPNDPNNVITKEVGSNDIVKTLEKMISAGVRVWGDPIPLGPDMASQWDADTADAVLQTLMLGVIVYG